MSNLLVQYCCAIELRHQMSQQQQGVCRKMFRGIVVAVAVCMAAVACIGPAPSGGSGKALNVIAAENFWGSIAAQIGGIHASVQSVVTDPNADPHEYESNTNDARAFAQADVVILNGAGYDDWGQK